MILFIIAGSLVFSQALSNSGATEGLLKAITSLKLTQFQVVIMMMLVLLFLGAFMDQVSMLLFDAALLPTWLEFASSDLQYRCYLAYGANADHHGNQPADTAFWPLALCL